MSDEHEKVFLFGQLGCIKNIQGDYDILQNTLSSDHSQLVISYKNIASMHESMGEYSKALPFYQQALEIEQKTLPSNHPDLATSHSNIGLVFQEMGEYWRAFSFFEKALPPFLPDLAVSYISIGCVYKHMGEYSKALLFFECAIDIAQHSLPPHHSLHQVLISNIEVIKEKL
jgi:tetratricopeptide (TPR) repeat protein